MGVAGNFRVGRGYLQPAGHAEVDDPLRAVSRPALASGWAPQIKHDVLADATDHHDSRMLQNLNNLFRLRLEGLRVFSQPNRFDRLARDAFLQPTGYRLDLG